MVGVSEARNIYVNGRSGGYHSYNRSYNRSYYNHGYYNRGYYNRSYYPYYRSYPYYGVRSVYSPFYFPTTYIGAPYYSTCGGGFYGYGGPGISIGIDTGY